ncbi:lasso RiPP family leader peptide-containing protein [Blastococcus sp. SYSU D00813]
MDKVAQKSNYHRPTLRSLGSLAELTLGNGSRGLDNCSRKNGVANGKC